MSDFRRELHVSDLERMCIPKRYWECGFAEITDKGDPSPRTVVKSYIDKIDTMVEKGVGLLLWGPNGRGKTSVAVVLCKELRRRGQAVMFVECASLKSAVIEKTAFDENQSIWDRAKSVDVLVLDDLGKGVQDKTGFGARVLDDLIRHRNASQRITFITTNMTPGPQMAEDLKVSTLHSLKECIIPVRIDGPDRREDSKAEILGLLSAEG